MEKLGKRKFVHVSMISFGLLVGRVSPLAISLTCLSALLFNVFLLPKLTKKSLEKQEDLQKGYSIGIIAYPAVLFCISLLFFSQQIYLVIGWGALAFGDAAAFYGRSIWSKPLPWNMKKTWGGILLFIISSSLLSSLFLLLLPSDALLTIDFTCWVQVIILSSIVAAIAETLEGFVDDNIVVPLVASVFAYFFIKVFMVGSFVLPSNLSWGLGAVFLFVLLSWASKKIDISGAIVGGIIAFLIFLGGGFEILSLLLLFFVLGSGATFIKKKEKYKNGLAEKNQGKRGVPNALANGGVAAMCGGLAWVFPQGQELFLAMLAASLASATADTFSSELGNAYGKRFVDIISWKEGRKGDDGVVSFEGTLLGGIGAGIMALVYLLASGQVLLAAYVFLAGLVGNYIDSVLGATLQRNGYMNNHTVNFMNTLSAVLFIWWLQKTLM
ncbi:DUF92 domain-containing protein [Flammeovirgaceae bacterium SG7u.111]|nr:DUF92 domain-containing protein [Flammeovirgaceae bacterium SG7u.132]WPO35177.1 DUF92 domain-containing protein [Flammeovirgaceae bacterium SG7u.111]